MCWKPPNFPGGHRHFRDHRPTKKVVRTVRLHIGLVRWDRADMTLECGHLVVKEIRLHHKTPRTMKCLLCCPCEECREHFHDDYVAQRRCNGLEQGT
jgi:hypothetical protein